jgi:hypothetical protein
MNLHAIASPLVGIVNPPVVGTWRQGDGYTTSPAGKREPTFTDVPDVPMQVQALEGDDLTLVDGLNIEGLKRAVYMYGDVQGIDRADGKGGDVLIFSGSYWLVVKVLETWATGWCKVAVAKQLAPVV